MATFQCPPDGNWHLVAERVTSISGPPIPQLSLDIKEDGTGWARNTSDRELPVDYTQAGEY